jgi:spore germination protein GerM
MVERFDEIKPQVEYICEGNPIEKTLFQDYMTKVYESQKQEQERKVMVISYKLDSIKEFSLNGNKYEVTE